MDNYISKAEYRTALNDFKEFSDKIKNDGSLSVMEIKTELLEYILTKGTLFFKESDTFPHAVVGAEVMFGYRTERMNLLRNALGDKLDGFRQGETAGIFTGDYDFSHTVPDWERLFALGFAGIAAETEKALSLRRLTAQQQMYLKCAVRVYKAITVYVGRLAEKCTEFTRFAHLAECYRRIAANPPRNLTDACALMTVYYFIQNNLDTEMLRSMGNLDFLLTPFYENSLKEGCPEKELDEILGRFFIQLRDFKFANNIPFCLCKTDFAGHTYYNEMSFRLLRVYASLNVQDPKIQIRCTEDAPSRLIEAAMQSIRNGNNSIVFINDTAVLPALKRIGISERDAEEYIPVGCYEPSAFGELACTCAGRVSLPKVVELTVSNGADALNNAELDKNAFPIASWDDFYNAFLIRLKNAVESSKRITAIYESVYEEVNPSLVLSPTYISSIEKAADLYGGGAKYNNTSINVFGIATAVDALVAVKHVVFDEKLYTLEQLADVLRSNWQNNEKLRLKCERKYPKFGNGDGEADEIAASVTNALDEMINGCENGRGGVFRLGMFSIDWYTEFGKKTGATADGRLAGDIISKNMSAVIGRDLHGVTGAIDSAVSADGKLIPNGTVLDLMLDGSAVKGRDGLAAMTGILFAFIKKGGSALQINVLDPEVLKQAKANPEKYTSLQVRLCGWNVYFTELSSNEQDEFIKMAEHLAG